MSEMGVLGAVKSAKLGADERSNRLDELRKRSEAIILGDFAEAFGGDARAVEASFFQHLSAHMERQLSWGTSLIEGQLPFRFSGRRAPLSRSSAEANQGSVGYRLDVSKEKLELRLYFDDVTRRMLEEPQAPGKLESDLHVPYDRRGETESRRFAAAMATYFGVTGEKLVKPELISEPAKQLLLGAVARQLARSFGSPPGSATAEFVPGQRSHILVKLDTPGVKEILSPRRDEAAKPRTPGGTSEVLDT